MKRIFDVVLALVGLVLAAPLFALIAVLIKLDSPGRVIFSQRRLGRDGRIFRIHKFRKFPDDWGDRGSGVTVSGDVRMTRLGRLLERSKFDELPQLWNILVGDMSFVGPRPESLRYQDCFVGDLAGVHAYTPGIFGPNQVAYRNEGEMYPPEADPDEFYRRELLPAKARADLEYFAQSTLWSDIRWIVLGVWHSLVGMVAWGRFFRQQGRHLTHDVLAVMAAWLLANLVRFEGLPASQHAGVLLTGLWLMPLIVVPTLLLAGCYRQRVRHFSLGMAGRLTVASTGGWLLAFVLLLALFHRSASLMLLPLGVLLTLPLLITPRLFYRYWKRRTHENGKPRHDCAHLAVYGAGQRGAALAHLLRFGFPRARVVGFLDDNDADMRGREIEGLKILGSERDLETIHALHELDQLWLTFVPNEAKRQRLQQWCRAHGVELVVLPAVAPFSGLADWAAAVETPPSDAPVKDPGARAAVQGTSGHRA